MGETRKQLWGVAGRTVCLLEPLLAALQVVQFVHNLLHDALQLPHFCLQTRE